MKRLSTIIMALVLALGLTQCKKDQPNPNVTEGETYTINLSVKGNSNAKVDVNTTTGTVDYTTGDQIHVASGGKYVGTLTYNGTVFTGNITNAVEGEPLQFYFLGNVTPAEELTSGVTESCSVVISDQTEHLPVISGAASVEIFEGNNSDYTAELLNKCALVKFNVTTASEAATCLKGFNNKVTIDFGQNSFTNSQEGEGIITLPAGNGEQWAILLPQAAMTGGEAYSANESHNGTFGAVPAIYANAMFTVGVPVEVNTVWHINPYTTPLTFEARVAGASVGLNNTSGINLQYSTDGTNWNDYSSAITLTNIGDIVQFRGNNESFGTNFQCFGQCYIYGNVMSLLHATEYATNYTLSEGAFTDAFNNCQYIDIHPEKDLVLPATTLASDCYSYMFAQCTSLTKTPALDATTMAERCYYHMFDACTGLTTVPENMLPATTLAKNCYSGMFYDCSNLTTAPALPATTLADFCYSGMFGYCSSLTTAPVLPATTLVSSCYASMFSGCSNLNSVTCLATSGINLNSSTMMWLNGVASSGTFTKASGANVSTNNSGYGSTWPRSNRGIPSGWTVVSQAPTAPTGAINGLFSVSTTKQVWFSKGNLQNNGTFATNQYDLGGTFTFNNYSGPSGYYTLSYEEWSYLLSTRGADKRGTATVNSVKGLLILPDNWTMPDGCSFNPSATNNVYDVDQWAAMENAGAVFLPAAFGDICRYWSSTPDFEDDQFAFYINFNTQNPTAGFIYNDGISNSYSVRLVCNVE